MIPVSLRLVLVFFTLPVWSQSQVTVPWQEFKSLYSQSIENELQQRFATTTPQALYTIDEANYQLTITTGQASADVVILGRVLRGQPEPLPLFANDIAITRVDEIQGATLLSDGSGYQLFVQNQEPFKLRCTIVVPVQEDEQSFLLSFKVPQAIRNMAKITLADDLVLTETSGLSVNNNQYYFAPSESFTLRFSQPAVDSITVPPAIDIVTTIALEGQKYHLRSYFAPSRAIRSVLQINLPQQALRDSSLKASWLKVNETGVQVKLPDDWQQVFTLDYEIAADITTELPMPTIVDNQGQEGQFQLSQPVDAQLSIATSAVQSALVMDRLPQSLRNTAGLIGRYQHLTEGSTVLVEKQQLQNIAQPETVLDAVYLYTSFGDNGTALSVLHLDVPAQAGNKLRLQEVADAEVWSLTVNGEKRRLYRDENNAWVIPLAKGRNSVVELAYLQNGEKLGLKGRLQLILPALGLAARKLNVGIALAERVELIAMEGALEPSSDITHWPKVKGFSGRPYYFSKPFYRGKEQRAAIYYKEPLQQGEQS